MKQITRLLVLGCAATASFALAGNALAKTPQLIVRGATTTGASAATLVEVKEQKTDAAPFRITIYVPPGYVLNISHPAGTQIGTASASLQALIFSDAIVTADGAVVTDSPGAHTSASDIACAGAAPHTAVWLVRVTVAGQTLSVPVYVDPTADAEASFSSAKLVLCLPNPYEQALPGTRAPGGAKIVDVKMTLAAGVITNPASAGRYVWRTVSTPWTVNGPTANAAGTIEAQSIVNIPASLSLEAKVKTIRHKRHGRTTVTNSVLLGGKLLENLQGVAGAKVTVYANGRTAGSTTTGSLGSFSRRLGLGKRTSFTVTAAVSTRETACVSPLTTVPAGCVSATLAGYRISSSSVTAKPKRG